jgi:hypothetical protein
MFKSAGKKFALNPRVSGHAFVPGESDTDKRKTMNGEFAVKHCETRISA